MAITPTEVSIVSAESLEQDECLDLYDAVGWSTYTRRPEALMRSLAGSHGIAAARQNRTLVGLARTISDGATIVYLQDILVHPVVQRSGVGRALVATLLGAYTDVRQRVLLTDDEPGQRAFYESLGFAEAHDMTPGMRAFVQLPH